jgi:hypothetical protein
MASTEVEIKDILNSVIVDGVLQTSADLTGDVTIDLTASNAILTTIDADTSALFGTVAAGRVKTTEASAADIKTATEALAAIISGGKLLTTETSASGIKTSVDAVATAVSSGKLLVTETNSGSVKTAVEATKTAIDTINTNIATLKDDTALIKARLLKTLSAAGSKTGSGDVTVSGTRVQVTNTSDTAGMSFTVGAITVPLDVNEASDIFDVAAFTAITFTQSTGMVANYKVWS